MHESNTLISSSDALDIHDTDVLCVPSSCLSSHLPSLSAWVEKADRYVLILWEEPSLESFLDISPRIKSVVLQDPIEESFKEISWQYVFLRVKLWTFGNSWTPASLFEKVLLGVHLVASDAQDFGKKVVANVCKNTLDQVEHFSFDALKGSLKGIPAIICGAGPSLSAHIEKLLELRSLALLMAGGASITALCSRFAPFHVAAGIDPEPDYQRFIESSAFEVPFFYQDRFSSEILSKIHAQKVRLPSSSNYPFEEWLKQEKGLSELSFDAGWTVTTMLISLATHLGCSPIVLVGVDLGSTDKLYSAELRASSHSDQSLSSHEIKTKSDWIMASHWIEEWIKDHPEVSFINTSSISSFEGSQKMSLESVQDRYLTKHYDIANDLHTALEEAKTKGFFDRAVVALDELKASKKRTESLLDAMVNLFEMYHPEDPSSKGEFILLEYDVRDELCYKVLVEPVWSIWKHVLARVEEQRPGHAKLHEILFLKKIINAHESEMV